MSSWNRRGLRPEWIMLAAMAGIVPTGCSTDTPEPPVEVRPAALAWTSQPEQIVPQDVKAANTEVVWVADDFRNVVVRIDPADSAAKMFGYLDSPPREVVEPRRIAVSPTVGIIAYDGSTRNIDLFTQGGTLIRSFTPGFAPAYMDVTSQPITLVSAARDPEPGDDPRLLILSTDLMGSRTDTVVGPNHGPAALAELSLNPRETSIAGSDTGMWVWSRTVADTVYDVPVRGTTKRLVLREEDRTGLGMLHDRDRQVLWIVHQDTAGYRYAGYGVGLEGEILGPDVYIGSRSTPAEFTPKLAIGGLVIGTAPQVDALVFAAYDMGIPED